MFSQQLCCGMERDCYCCRPGPSLPNTAPVPYMFEPHAGPIPCHQSQMSPLGPVRQLAPLRVATSQIGSTPQLGPTIPSCLENKSMDVDLALSELDNLQISTGYNNESNKGSKSSWTPNSEVDMFTERRGRYRSFSESTSGLSQGLKQSSSESSVYKAVQSMEAAMYAALAGRPHCRRLAGSKPGCSMSLPRKVGGYQMVQRNTVYVADISPCPWDSGVSSFSEQSSLSDSSPPCSMRSYRDSDLLEERSRQRRMSRYRLDRSRRLRQPYSIPFRMCQSMNEDSTASLQDFLSTISIPQPPAASSTGPQSTTASPVKPDNVVPPGSGSLKRSQSIDNLELSKLRLADAAASAPPKPSLLARSRDTLEMEQVASTLKNLHLQFN